MRIGYTAGPSGNYISLAQPQITIDGSRGVLSAVSAGRSHGLQPNVDQARRDIAVLDLGSAARTETATTVTWTSVGATLTADAVPLVLRLEGSSFFLREAGATLDPVTIYLSKVEPE
ncbi:MAG: HtaA domain-containing protein, partial [Cellulomonadaceae bacterium]